MKKAAILIISVVFLFCLCSCKTEVVTLYDGEVTSYVDEQVMNNVKSLIESKPSSTIALSRSSGYYFLQDEVNLRGRYLTSMTVPIFRTYTPDKNGDYTLTLVRFRVNGAIVSLVQGSEIAVKINGKEYGLEPSDAGTTKYIEIDLRPYDIQLREDEILGFSSPSDNIELARVLASDLSVLNTYGPEYSKAFGFYSENGKKQDTTTIPVNFSWRTTVRDSQEAQQEAYMAQLAAQLKQKYQGKYLSIVGDSISTFGNVTNNASYNSTIGENAVYYKKTEKMPEWTYTYWGRVATELGMNLCCMNAWSGSYVYGQTKYSFKDAGVKRAQYLYNENGTPTDPSDDIYPDLILVYLGINDFNGFGLTRSVQINEMIKKAAGDEAKLMALIDEWFKDLLEATDDAEKIEPSVDYHSFDEAYALMLYRMIKYNPDAEILCMGYMGNGKTAHSNPKMVWYNEVVGTICRYFKVDFLDWGATIDIDNDTAKIYDMDVMVNNLHPNTHGHQLMANEIIMRLSQW